MAITKKSQILQLHNEGYGIDDIIGKGFTKKYASQVLKEVTNSKPTVTSTHKTKMNYIKQLVSTVEYLQNKYDHLNLNINISIKFDGYNNISSESKILLLNPVTTFRDIGKVALKEKLLALPINDLIKIAKTYTPDLSGIIYRKRDVALIVDYIIERSTNLSKLGQVFRDTNNQK
ncbi:hypothetical protein KPL37_18165 [Clostridium frigoris]|uniref:DNA-directed DNA polymerase n=1 Tax=Clostridium frigoris TaxID=205327 RepID=A0ABS6BYC3_9CLOT|nr:hypothetical protein [Clostridium frigoris]MBU3161625.1 hypothetical protein [Clostridium frigoris]